MDQFELDARSVNAFDQYAAEQKSRVERLINKWEWLLAENKKLGTKAIPENMWRQMAILFENQAVNSDRGKSETAQLTTDIYLPIKWTLPIIRKFWPELFIQKICSVQPMPPESGGTARIFYQDFVRTEASSTSLTTNDSDYAISSEGDVPKRIKMTITTDTLTAAKDMLGATWSTEVMEDASGVLGIDIESELINNAAMEIGREFEQRIIAEILAGASAGNVNFDTDIPSGYTLRDRDYYETLQHKFIDAEDLIMTTRYRKADYILCGREVTKYLMKSSDFKPEPRLRQTTGPFQSGVEFVGTLSGLWQIYTSMYMTSSKALMGIWPTSMTDCGYIWAPYIPIMSMPLVYAEYVYDESSGLAGRHGMYRNTDMWSRNIRTRNGKKFVVKDMFATITLT
jgi:hypothetical protein